MIFILRNGFIVFAVAATTDYFDGYLARKRSQITTLGQLLDPVADKLLISAAFISLVQLGIAPAWMVIIIVGIINTMFISVRERTREIGSLRAIGMRRSRVLLMILTEAFLLGIMASTFGSLLGAGIASGLNAIGVPVPEGAMRSVLMSDTLHLVG